jgi:DNA-binding CsgD family transcriptional regulator
MTGQGVERLTTSQKACLRLVLLQMSSKDIAKRLGTSPHTVDNHIKTAIQRLGVATRAEASLQLAAFEGIDLRRALADQTPELGNETCFAPPLDPQVNPQRVAGAREEAEVKIGQQNGADLPPSFLSSLRLPLPRYLGEENNLSTAARLGWIIVLIILISLAAGALLSGIEALTRLA